MYAAPEFYYEQQPMAPLQEQQQQQPSRKRRADNQDAQRTPVSSKRAHYNEQENVQPNQYSPAMWLPQTPMSYDQHSYSDAIFYGGMPSSSSSMQQSYAPAMPTPEPSLPPTPQQQYHDTLQHPSLGYCSYEPQPHALPQLPPAQQVPLHASPPAHVTDDPKVLIEDAYVFEAIAKRCEVIHNGATVKLKAKLQAPHKASARRGGGGEWGRSADKQGRNQITVGELRRRAGAPEFAGVLELAALLRKPRSGASELLRKCYAHGVEPRNNLPTRNAAPPPPPTNRSIFAALPEEEAFTLAKDFGIIAKDGLDAACVAAAAVETTSRMPGACGELAQAMSFVRRFLETTRAHLVSRGLRPAEQFKCAEARSAEQQAIKTFALWTHGFGPVAGVGALDFLLKLCGEVEKRLAGSRGYAATPVASPAASSSSADCSFASTSSSDSGVFSSPNSGYAASPASSSSFPQRRAYGKAADAFENHVAALLPGDNDIFDDKVLARLRADGVSQVTYGEVRRRVDGPEGMHTSMLCAYLRKSKKSGRYDDIRARLDAHGVQLRTGKTKKMSNSAWTALTEAEACELASHAASFLAAVPPSDAAMAAATREAPETLETTKRFFTTLYELFARCGLSPLAPAVASPIDAHIHRFACMTHHFGHAWLASVAQWLACLFFTPSTMPPPHFYGDEAPLVSLVESLPHQTPFRER